MKILIDKQLVESAISELISAQVESHFLAKQYVIDDLQSAIKNHNSNILKECRDMLVLCTLIDKSGQCQEMVDKIDLITGWK